MFFCSSMFILMVIYSWNPPGLNKMEFEDDFSVLISCKLKKEKKSVFSNSESFSSFLIILHLSSFII